MCKCQALCSAAMKIRAGRREIRRPAPVLHPPPRNSYCEIWTFTFCSGMREQFPVGRTLDRFA
jgi:hypothetical protein